ncbi:auxin-responsive protein SAUR76-like [Typha latifolia]|uniref:auxin-responsive protein SAUR76-like n=1 Tax=Typha latifolia TaxID=4733 RepID=UPI003C2F9B3E
MAKSVTGKLNKIKCMLKRWNSSSHIAREDTWSSPAAGSSSSFHGDEVPAGLHPVYVGKSRRRYLVSSDLIGHPLFRNLVERCGGAAAGDDGATVVGCEVVLFEHLLWMLENADPMPESADELVDFYAC